MILELLSKIKTSLNETRIDIEKHLIKVFRGIPPSHIFRETVLVFHSLFPPSTRHFELNTLSSIIVVEIRLSMNNKILTGCFQDIMIKDMM